MTPNDLQRPTGSAPGVFRYGCGILGVGLALFSLFFVVAAFVDLVVNRDAKEAPVLVGMLILFGGLTAAGVFTAWKFFGKTRPQPDAGLENKILRLAEAKGCRLTVGMVALHCQVGIAESREALERMVLQGAANPVVEDDGGIVYDFSDLLPSGGSRPRAGENPVQLP
jgi:hypothetical protein